MKQKSNKKHLLTKYCEGRLSSEEWLVIQRWMAISSNNRNTAQQLLKLYRNRKALDLFDSISYENAFETIITKVKKKKRRRRFIQVASLAASVLLIISLGSLLFLLCRKDVMQPAPVVAQVITPGSVKATLTLGNGQQVILEDMVDSVITSNTGIEIHVEAELLDYQNSKGDHIEMNSVKTPRGGEYNLLLADGTRVWLNSDSELKFPVSFVGDKREVSLSGEAYLEVAHNADKPFVVHSSRGDIHVLGTSFNIKDYSDEDVMITTLVEGKVRLTDDSSHEAILSSSMQGTIRSGEAINVKRVDVAVYTAWKDGLFSFHNKPLVDIITDLSRWYNFDYEFKNEQLKSLRFTGEIKRYENLKSLLHILEKTNEVNFEYNNGILLVN